MFKLKLKNIYITTIQPKMFPANLQKYISEKTTRCELGVIRTYQVRPVNNNGKIIKRGADDITYQLHPELVDLVPRGFSTLEIEDTDTVIYLKGMKKFTGETPYDDDDITPETADQIEKKEISDVDLVRFQTKANGKMGIAMLFVHDSTMYIFGGSKNVHIVRRFDQEITGNQLHERILAHVQKDLAGISPLPLDTTLVGEYEDGCHIIYREIPRMVYFVGDDRLPSVQEIFPPQTHLPTVEQIQSIRNMTDIEGIVIVYYKNDQVIERKKIKTISYVLLRAAREKFCHTNKEEYKETFASLLQTLRKRGDSTFLDLDDKTIQYWFERLVKFAEFIAGHPRFCFKDLSFRSSIGMARAWHAFTCPETKNEAQSISPKIRRTLTLSDLLNEENQRRIKFAQNVSCPVLVITRGPSGSGKSSLARILQWATFCTDDEFMVNGIYCYDPKKIKQHHNTTFNNFCAYMKSGGRRAILANTSLLRWEFERYSRFMYTIGGISVVVNMNIPDVDTLCQRNTHSVPKERIAQQVEKFKTPIYPQYYGAFFRLPDIPDYRMSTVPHITLLFCGGTDRERIETFENFTSSTRTFTIRGFSSNLAGTCILVETPPDMPCSQQLHITTSVNHGFKPADVGINTVLVSEKLSGETISGIVGPTF